MTIQNNPELKKLTVELSHDEAAVVSEALKAAHEAGHVLHPILGTLHSELRHIAQKLGLIKPQ